jgi:hypothetical protein
MSGRYSPAVLLTPLLALLLALPPGHAAPAPELPPDQPAQVAFEALKKKLPELAAAWTKEHWYAGKVVEVKVARRVGPAEAKVTFLAHSTNEKGQPDPSNDQLFSVYLRFYDGAWTSTRFEAGWSSTNDFNARAAHFLMLAIDQLGGK